MQKAFNDFSRQGCKVRVHVNKFTKSAECNEEISKLKTGFFLANLHPVRGWEIK